MKLLSKVTLAFSSLLLTTPALLSVTSCQKEIEIFFHISSRLNYVVAGGQLQLSLFTTPVDIPSDELKWEIIDNPYPEQIKVNQKGLITVSEDIEIKSLISVDVKVSWNKKTTVFATKTINVSPQTQSDFLGFTNNKITYIDRARNEQSVNILHEEGSSEYYTDKPIDLFMSDDEAYFKFDPVIADKASKFMYFWIDDDPTKEEKHALAWRLYNDGTPIDTIPKIYVQHFMYRKDSVTVKFDCDKTITLKIKFNAWQSFHSTTNGEVSYVPNVADKPGHSVIPSGDGVFDSQMFCPSNGTEKYVDTMTSVYFYRNPYEYLQYDRFEIEKSTNPLIQQGINVELDTTKTILREFDDYPVYKVDIKCTFDLSIIKEEEFDSESVLLFTIFAYDDFYAPSVASRCNFAVQWMG